MAVRERAIKTLWRSLEKSGATISRSIEIFQKNSSVGGGRMERSRENFSMRAVKPIKPFDILIQIPYHCCLIESYPLPTTSTAENTIKDVNEQQLSSPDPEGAAQLALVGSLLKEMQLKEKSKHFQYLQTLPDEILSFPQSWSPEMWKGLENTTFKRLYDQREIRRRLLRKISQNDSKLGDINEIDSLQERWAECMVTSRSIDLERTVALVPMIDFCNHDDKISTEPLGNHGCIVLRSRRMDGYPDSMDGYTLVAIADHEPGMELFRYYGDLTFEEKILEYGWLDREAKLSNYSTMKLAIPLIAQLHLYGKLQHRDRLCVFSGRQQDLFADVCAFLQREKISRGAFARGLNRRLNELMQTKAKIEEEIGMKLKEKEVKEEKEKEKAERMSLPDSSNHSSVRAIVIHPSPTSSSSDPSTSSSSSSSSLSSNKPSNLCWDPQEEDWIDILLTKKEILTMELKKIEVLLLLVGKEQKYRQFVKTKLPEIEKQREKRESDEMVLLEQIAVILHEQTGLDLSQLFDDNEDEGEGEDERDGETGEDENEDDEKKQVDGEKEKGREGEGEGREREVENK